MNEANGENCKACVYLLEKVGCCCAASPHQGERNPTKCPYFRLVDRSQPPRQPGAVPKMTVF